jgi:peroxiredoxin Q/BCP
MIRKEKMMIQTQIILIVLLAFGLGLSAVVAGNSIQVGNPAPVFTLADQNGDTLSLSDYLGQWVLLYFYPKDDTPGCTKEACTFRDRYEEFKTVDLKVFGVSTDGIESHKDFAEKYHLPFSLLADSNAEVTKLYGVKQPLINIAKRHSFLIGPEGKIRKIYENVTPADHPEEILEDLKILKSE